MTAPDYTDLCAQGEAAAIALAMRPKQRKVANLLADLIAAIRELEAQLVQSGDRAAELMIQHMRRAEAAEAKLAEVEKGRDAVDAAWCERVATLTATTVAQAAQIEAMRGALTFYRNGFERKTKRSKTGLVLSVEYVPTETLLNDCGNRADDALDCAALTTKEQTNG